MVTSRSISIIGLALVLSTAVLVWASRSETFFPPTGDIKPPPSRTPSAARSDAATTESTESTTGNPARDPADTPIRNLPPTPASPGSPPELPPLLPSTLGTPPPLLEYYRVVRIGQESRSAHLASGNASADFIRDYLRNEALLNLMERGRYWYVGEAALAPARPRELPLVQYATVHYEQGKVAIFEIAESEFPGTSLAAEETKQSGTIGTTPAEPRDQRIERIREGLNRK